MSDAERGANFQKGDILTKQTGGAARRNALPHQHVLFHKGSELSCSGRKTKVHRMKGGKEKADRKVGKAPTYASWGGGVNWGKVTKCLQWIIPANAHSRNSRKHTHRHTIEKASEWTDCMADAHLWWSFSPAPWACLCVSTVPDRCMCVLRSWVAVIRLDFWAGDRVVFLGLGLAVGLLHTLDMSCRGQKNTNTLYL